MESKATDFDVIVVGSGAAGQMAAATASTRCRVGLVTDRGLGTSNSAVAQGGLQLPDDDDGSVDQMQADMLRSGGPTVDLGRIDHFCRSVRPAVQLLESWGLELDRDADGEVMRLLAGGLSAPRIVTAGERIGPAVLSVLRRRLLAGPVKIFTRTRVIDLESLPDRISVITEERAITARAVIVATGGNSFEYAAASGLETSNPRNSNGSLRSALRTLGIAEVESEEYQLHPYGIVGPSGEATGKCVPESVGTLGGFVADRSGLRLAPEGSDRRTVTRSMEACMSDGRGVPVGSRTACRLVLDAPTRRALFRRYPHCERHVEQAHSAGGSDIAVRPIVHYQLGGFVVRPDGATSVERLFLAGEITGGLHGQNRLMGNGITEAVVDGWSAAQSAVRLVG